MLSAPLATIHNTAEWLRVNFAQCASKAETHAELTSESAAVPVQEKEFCALVGQIKDTRRKYKDDCNNLLTNLNKADLNAEKLVDICDNSLCCWPRSLSTRRLGGPTRLTTEVEHQAILRHTQLWGTCLLAS